MSSHVAPTAGILFLPWRRRSSSAFGSGRRVPLDLRAVVALPGEAVARRARALEDLAPERVADAGVRGEERLVLSAGDDVDESDHVRVLEAAELGAAGLVASPIFSALNQVWFVRPGIASILPPSAGTHQLWMTSGVTTSSVTTRFSGDDHVLHRDLRRSGT